MMENLKQNAFLLSRPILRGFSLGGGLLLCVSVMASSFPTVHLNELPDPLRSVWKELKPEMTEMSHCAAAFDSHSDGEKMAFRCSIHIKMSAEGERRAMKYCEEKRAEKNIKAPCRLVVE
jgi:hypothetical protein